MKNRTLDAGQKHILQLIERDKKPDGWSTVSAQLYPTLSSNIPAELATFEKLETGGRVKLTESGKAVLSAMEWLQEG